MNDNRNIQEQLDRLVAGELDKPAARSLVKQLDAEEDGWKRCALAYMEAQSWQRAFFALLTPADDIHQATAGIATAETIPMEGRRTSELRKSPARLWASVVAAFVIGVGMTAWWQQQFGGSPATDIDRDDVARKNESNNRSPINVKRDSQSKPATPADKPLVGLVRISSRGITEIAFPVLGERDGDSVPPDFGPPVLTEYVLRVLERKGLQVEQHRKIVSIVLADGYRFHFPVDWVQYRRVGQRVY